MNENTNTPTDRSTVRAWRVCEEDTVAATTAEEALAWYLRETGLARDDVWEEPEEVELTRKLCRDEDTNALITYAQAIANCTSFPCVLASTEY